MLELVAARQQDSKTGILWQGWSSFIHMISAHSQTAHSRRMGYFPP